MKPLITECVENTWQPVASLLCQFYLCQTMSTISTGGEIVSLLELLLKAPTAAERLGRKVLKTIDSINARIARPSSTLAEIDLRLTLW